MAGVGTASTDAGVVVTVAPTAGTIAELPSERITVTLSRPSRSSSASNRRDDPGTSDTLPGSGGRYSPPAGGTTNTVYSPAVRRLIS